MQIRFAPPTLQALDREHGGTLVVHAFTDERPLRGLAGRVDWRLCGRLSGLLAGGDVSADFGATLLCPTDDRLPFARLLFIGLGSVTDYNAELYAEANHLTAWKLARMGERHFAMALPTFFGRGLGVREAVWGWRHGLIRSFDSDGLRELQVCVLADRTAVAELKAPMTSVADEVNEALRREAEQRAIANAPPLPQATTPIGDDRGRVSGGRAPQPSVPGPHETPRAAAPAATKRDEETEQAADRATGRRGWQSGVMKIGPATAVVGSRGGTGRGGVTRVATGQHPVIKGPKPKK
mgnify:CR=1 FL=1